MADGWVEAPDPVELIRNAGLEIEGDPETIRRMCRVMRKDGVWQVQITGRMTKTERPDGMIEMRFDPPDDTDDATDIDGVIADIDVTPKDPDGA